MIIRSSFDCETCGQNHVVRIGMGHDDRQVHRFPCRACGEEMVIALNVSYEDLTAHAEAVENARAANEGPKALFVNVHANFILKETEKFKDSTFPHMQQMAENFSAAERYGSIRPVSADDLKGKGARPFRRPDFSDEWKLLKKAWSLHSRGRDKLSQREILEASSKYYLDDPLAHLSDWIWRFSMFLGATKYEILLRDIMNEVVPIIRNGQAEGLIAEYKKGVAVRSRRYFDILRDYFSAWEEFSQVHFSVSRGLPVSPGHSVASSGFRSVKMFYGNAFEVFSSLIDILAFFNNLIEGRDWKKFELIDDAAYLRLDKAKRFDALMTRSAFMNLCEEKDNQLRNASHHDALEFVAEAGRIRYRLGKGNLGEAREISYTDYLTQCSKIFFQIVTLLRTDLLICNHYKIPFPK